MYSIRNNVRFSGNLSPNEYIYYIEIYCYYRMLPLRMRSPVRSEHFREKYEQYQAHIKYLLDKGWDPLKIADQMTHFMILSLREGFRNQHPEWSEVRLLQAMREKIVQDKQLQIKRG